MVALEPEADHADQDDDHHYQDNDKADDTWGWRKELSEQQRDSDIKTWLGNQYFH